MSKLPTLLARPPTTCRPAMMVTSTPRLPHTIQIQMDKIEDDRLILIQLPLTNPEGTNPPNPPAVLNLRLIEAVALELPS